MWNRVPAVFSWLQRLVAPSRPESHIRGSAGEDAAADFFTKRLNYKVIVRNWQYRRDEIDLVCRDRDVLVFIEIKTRAADALVPGYYAVGERKKKALRRAVHAY